MARVEKVSEELEEVIRRLVKSLQPDQIYLFGSYALGTQIPGQSDIDLLVIVPDSDLPRHQREARSYDSLWGLTTPVELVVMTRKEFNRARKVKTTLAAAAQNRGLLLYG